MFPSLTPAILDRAIATPRMVSAGRDYWRQKRVQHLDLDEASATVMASVFGSEPHPYRVEIVFRGNWVGSTMCTCPVGGACKHVAAVLYAFDALNGLGAVDEGPSPIAAQPVERLWQSPVPRVDLSPALTRWMSAMQPAVERERVRAEAASREIVYIVKAQALWSSAKASKKRSASSLALPGCPVRLRVEPVDVALDAAGTPQGSGRKVEAPSLYGLSVASSSVSEEDGLLLRRLQTRGGDVDYEGCIEGFAGTDLLRHIIATGRARWDNVRGPVIQISETALAQDLFWQHDEMGRAQLTLRGVAPGHIVGLATPPMTIDPETGRAFCLDLGTSAALAEKLLRLPPIEPDSVNVIAARWSELAPPHVPPPVAPTIRDLGVIEPVSVLNLRVDKVKIDTYPHRKYRRARIEEKPCAIARLSFDYGVKTVDASSSENTYLVQDAEGLVRFERDRAWEVACMMELPAYHLFPVDEFEEAYPDPERAWDYVPSLPASASDFADFLFFSADEMREDGWRIEVAHDFPLRPVAVDPGDLDISALPSGIDWFDIQVGISIGGERIDLAPVLRDFLVGMDSLELDRLELALGDHDQQRFPVVLTDGRVAMVEGATIFPVLRALLQIAGNESSGDAMSRPSLGFSRLDLGLMSELDHASSSFAIRGIEPLQALARSLDRLQFEPSPLPEAFKAGLRPYQQIGFDWLQSLAAAGLGGLLADDMGLGKTIQTIVHILAQKASGGLNGPVLIVAPTSVLPNWKAELARFAPDLSILMIHGSKRQALHDLIASHDVVVTSYPLLVRDTEALKRETFGLVVFDEAHVLKNPQTAGHVAAKGLHATRKIALSGTPIENRLLDAWAIFDLVVPGLLGHQRSFVRDYRNPIEREGDTAAKARFARKVRPFMLRRTKDSVATDLPAKTIVPIPISLGSAQMALHESQRVLMQKRVREEIARVGLMRANIIVLTALTRLRQVCCDPRLLRDENAKSAPSAKLERLMELLDELIPEGRQIILFSQFTAMLDLIKDALAERGHRFVELTGQTLDRESPVADFQAGRVPLMLISLKAGGSGLNLTAADTVILYDPWWNPAVEAQAIDRAHRLGQERPVFVYRLIATDTIEEKILVLQERKAALANMLWDEEVAIGSGLSDEDIQFLLG